MYYEIYVDQLIFLDFIMNMYLLYLVKTELESGVTIRKLISCSFLNAVLFAFVMLIPQIPFYIKIVFQVLICNGILVNYVFKDLTFMLRVRAYMLMHGIGVLFGGSIMAFHRLMRHILGSTDILWWEIIIAATVFYLVQKRYLHIRKKQKNVMQYTFNVEMDFYGSIYTCIGLYDSGNFLYEPCTGRPAILVEKKYVEQLLDRVPPEKNYVIPYHSVGNEKGLLRAVEIPRLVIQTNDLKIVHEKVIAALCEQHISQHYQAIIHPYFVDKT